MRCSRPRFSVPTFRAPNPARLALAAACALTGSAFAQQPPPLVRPGVTNSPPPLLFPPGAAMRPGAGAGGVEAATAPVLSVDEVDGTIERDPATGVITAINDAVLETPDFAVRADRLTYDPNTKSGEAVGEVALTQKAFRVLTRKLAYDTENRELTTDALRLGKPPIYLGAQGLTGNASDFTLRAPTLYFNEPDPFGLNITGSSATYFPETEEITIRDAVFRIGGVPFFYLPTYTQEREQKPPFGTQTRFGFRNDLGAYGQTTTYYTAHDELQPGLLLDFYSKRGPLAGPALLYNYTDDPAWYQSGSFQSGFIHDYGDRGLDLNNRPVPMDRFFANWLHKGTIAGEVELTSSMYWWSDSNVLRDFRQGEWTNNQLPDNFVEALHRGENYLASVFVRYNPNNFQVVQQRLPEVRLDYAPSPLGAAGIYQEGQASYVQLRQQNFTAAPTVYSNRFDAYYGWRRPYSPNDWFTITPVAGSRVTSYLNTITQQNDFTRILGQVGFDAEIRAAGRWDVQSKTWGIDGLRHVVRPVMSYRYIPNAQQGSGQIPVVDQQVFTSYPPVFDLNDTRSVDLLYNTNILRYGLENNLQTRDPVYGSRELASFNIYNDVLFQSIPGLSTFSNIWTSLGIHPAPWLRFDVFNRFDPGALTLREIRTRTTLLDAETWNVSLYTNYLQNQIAQYWIDARYRIRERWTVYGRWRYDQNLGMLTEQAYGVLTRLGESWDIQFEVANFRGTSNQNGIGFNVKAQLLNF